MPKTKTKSAGAKWPAADTGIIRGGPARRNRRKEPITLSEPLKAFCQRLQLSDSVELACRLARATFKLDGPITLDRKIDPETSDEWVSICVTAKGEIDAIADAYDAYTRQWLRHAPPHARGKVRLSLVAA